MGVAVHVGGLTTGRRRRGRHVHGRHERSRDRGGPHSRTGVPGGEGIAGGETTAGRVYRRGPGHEQGRGAGQGGGDGQGGKTAGTGPGRSSSSTRGTAGRRRLPALALARALLCLAVAAGGAFLLFQRLQPGYVEADVFAAARSGVEDVYAYDHRDSEGSMTRELDAPTGELRDQYEADLSQGGIIDTYEQVSATTSYDVLEVGLQQVDDAQDQATLVVFGQYVVESVNSGTQAAPAGSECTVTPEGAQSCTQTVRVTVTDVDGDWRISELTLLTTS